MSRLLRLLFRSTGESLFKRFGSRQKHPGANIYSVLSGRFVGTENVIAAIDLCEIHDPGIETELAYFPV